MSQVFANNSNSFNLSTIINRVPDDGSEIHAWLSPLDPRMRHQDIRSQRMDGVGSWLLETREFRSWNDGGGESDRAILFCHGNPGVGKSYITSLVIDKLCDEAIVRDTAVTCFYFDFATRKEQSPINMLGSLLKQLVSRFNPIPKAIVQEFQEQKKLIGGRGPQISGILKMFHTIATTKRTFICIDALDECAPEYRVVVLDSLGQILRGSPNTRMFMTGRSHVRCEIERRLGRAAVSILIKPMEDDVLRYLRERLRNDTTPEIMSDTLKMDILKRISKTSSETFLLVALHIDGVLRETTIARRKTRLRSMSNGVGLGGAYDATLERIKAQDGEKLKLAMATLMWVCHSERSLQADELCHALAVEIGSANFDPDNVPLMATLLGCCQGLITVDKEASTVRLIHYTLQEYLSDYPHLFSTAHSTIAETCLTYLNSRQVKRLPPYPLPDQQSMPFLKYSSRHWGTHAKREFSDGAMSLALELLSRYETHISATSVLKQSRGGYDFGDGFGGAGSSSLFSALHCASFFGIVELATTSVDNKACGINQRDCTGATPLLWAAENGHEEVVMLLLDQENVSSDEPDRQRRTPLWHAALSGHVGVVKTLLERKDVDPNYSDNLGWTPLMMSAVRGQEGLIKLLLERKDIDPSCQESLGRTALSLAAAVGKAGSVKMLLERKDVDPNCPDSLGLVALSWAAARGEEGVIRILLEQEDVDPNCRDLGGRTALWFAAGQGKEGLLKPLLERKDIDFNCQDNSGRTALWVACAFGHEGLVKLLLEQKNIDLNCPNNLGTTALHVATMLGHERLVKLLLEQKNIDPKNCRNNEGSVPLSSAFATAFEGIANPLVLLMLFALKDAHLNRPDNQN